MYPLKLDPVRDAGKFVYHLKSLQQADLISFDKQTKKYTITELGTLLVDFARDVEEYVAVKKGKLFVRTSRLAIEEFNRIKISRSLMTEAGIPYELAEEIAAEAEERLIKLKTNYLTAPLIREFVNAILVERKLEEYRHKLTRLGMPVYDVTQLIGTASQQALDSDTVRKAAGSAVMEEYVLLNCLPREIADAHMSGGIHIENLDDWILKPCEFQHDLRFFLKKGLPQMAPPRNLNTALSLARAVYTMASTEVSSEQSFDMFNIFLAPYIKGESKERVAESIELFFGALQTDSLIRKGGLTLGYEFTVPSFLREVEAVGPDGKPSGRYHQYRNETALLIDLSLDAISRLSNYNPVANPRLLFKLRDETLKSEDSKRQMLRTLRLSANQYNPYYCILKKESKANYTATGLRLDEDWTNFWEADCQRTGCADTLFVNLPRLAYQAKKNDDRLIDSLRSELGLIVKAHKTKREYLQDILKQTLLPTLSGADKSDSYVRSENFAYVVSPIGLNEAVLAHTGLALNSTNEGSIGLALRIMSEMREYMDEAAKESGMRFRVAHRPCDYATTRLAELDVEEFGASTAVTQGLKEYPYYTDTVAIPLTNDMSLQDRISLESKFQVNATGGHLLPIALSRSGNEPEGLLKLTEWIFNHDLEFFTYTGIYTVCRSCRKWQSEYVPTCSKCGSDNVEHAGRSSATMQSLRLWPTAKLRLLDRIVQYSPSDFAM